MLYIDDVKVDRLKMADTFGADLMGIEKQPSFELDKKFVFTDKANGNISKVNKGVSIRTKFRTILPGTRQEVEVRYATSRVPQKNSNGTAFDYLPRYTLLEGQKFAFQGDLDLALFIFLYPENTVSPCRVPGRRYTDRYEFIDSKARAIKRMNTISQKRKALDHAETTDFYNLMLLAKGLNVPGAAQMDEDTLRVAMLEYADDPKTADKYARAIDDAVVKIEGRITHMIDQGLFKIHKSGNARQWRWAAGNRDGETVGPFMTNPQQDAKKTLLNFLLSNLHEYQADIYETTNAIKAREKAAQFLKENEVKETTATVQSPVNDNQEDDILSGYKGIELPDWNVWNDVRSFVEGQGYKKIPADCKLLAEAGKEGHITSENVSTFLKQNFKRAED